MPLTRRSMFKRATAGAALIGATAFQPAIGQTATSDDFVLVCTEDNVRIRSKPSLSSKIRGTVDIGDHVSLTGVSVEADGYRWIPVSAHGTNLSGWTTVDYFERLEGELGWLPGTRVHVNTTRVNLHSGAGVNYTIVGNFNTGTEAIINGGPEQTDGHPWYNITIDNVTGWMSQEYLTEGPYTGDGTTTMTVAAVGGDTYLTHAEADASYDRTSTIDVRKHGAVGDDTSDDTPGIADAAAIAAGVASPDTRAVLGLAPAGRHLIGRRINSSQVDGGVYLQSGVSLNGHGAVLELTNNASLITNHWGLSQGDNYLTDGRTATTQTTISADVKAGATSFSVTTSAGFAAGDDVFVRLNDNAWDAWETKDPFYAKVARIPSSTSLTLDRPTPMAMTVATTTAANRVIQKLVKPTIGGTIQDVTLVNPMTGLANAEAGIDLRYARGFHIENIIADDPGPGAVMLAYPEDVTVRNVRVRHSAKQGGQASKGRVINIWNAKNVRIENLYGEQFEGTFLMAESYCRNVALDGVHIVNNHPARANATEPLMMINQGSSVAIRNMIVEGNGGCPLIDEGGTTGNQITIEDLWLNTTTPIKGGLDLRYVSGLMRIGNRTYHELVRRTIPFRLFPNISATYPLPTGLYRRVKVFVNTAAGLTGFYLQNTSGQGNTFVSNLVGGQLVELPGLNQYGTDYPFATVDTKRIAIYGNADVPEGAYGFLDIEYWPTDANDGSNGRSFMPSLNSPSYSVSNLTLDRSFDANNVTTAELADVLGTLIADLRQSGWIK